MSKKPSNHGKPWTSAEEAELSEVDKSFMWRRQFLNAYAFWGGGDAIAAMEPGASPRKR